MEKKLISNTGPLIALAIVNKLDILRLLFESVVVPQAVHEEILQGGQLNKGLVLYQNSQWIRVQRLSESPDILLNSVLDKGEASVIQLARECRADIVLIDERKGRKIARDIYNMNVIGTAGILIEAKQKGIIPNIRDSLTEMCNSGYRIHDNIIDFALKKADEK